ncbi:discoidin domain-containing protein [Bacteroides thetaiotaomicron]|uniref:discoidin domain-containing protein n=1 Tax=Bacteroides thetaiotaomicron TaxID=818 RepID=UPI00286E5CBF|nr:discoidin domain-containing protein [Bacteroides thetaiotaomicron]MCS2261356.1 discoidin domain-containing protein [Bacteroides thetaiotaomicron]
MTANTEEKTGKVSAAYPHNGQTISLIDGEINTFWHSKWQGGEVAPPYEIILDMGKENSVSQLGLIARQNALTSMNLEIYAGDDGETWNLIGKYFFDGSIKTEQMVPVKACDARWIRIYIPTLGSGSSVGHLAEIYVYGTDK